MGRNDSLARQIPRNNFNLDGVRKSSKVIEDVYLREPVAARNEKQKEKRNEYTGKWREREREREKVAQGCSSLIVRPGKVDYIGKRRIAFING